MKQLPLAMRLRERALFDSFVPGANEGAVGQLRTLASGAAAGSTGGVYWLSGPPAVGKSHLLQASCALARAAGADTAYLPLAQLAELGPEALEGWSAARVVALDDLAMIVGRRDGAGAGLLEVLAADEDREEGADEDDDGPGHQKVIDTGAEGGPGRLAHADGDLPRNARKL